MSAIIDAASVVLTRGPDATEFYVVRRAESLTVFGGFHAFPGGKLHPSDVLLWPDQPRLATAVRELFEETGVLLARRPDGRHLPHHAGLEEVRRELLAERLSFADLLQRFDLRLNANDFSPAGSFVTPPFSAHRYNSAFYVALLPEGQEPHIWPGELVDGRWVHAGALLDEWVQGESLITPPMLIMLEAIRGRSTHDLPVRLAPHLTALEAGRLPTVICAPGVQLLPLRTIALPPSTHTNAYLVGRDPAYLLDPGCHEPAEQERLFQALDARLAEGVRLRGVVLTHHHPDHIGAANVCASRYNVPIWGHARTAELLANRVQVTQLLADGDRLELGHAPHGRGPWYLEAIFTPGHAPGHLAFFEPHYRLLFAGDMVSTLSSVVIGPPDGDLAVYLDSLRRLQRYDTRLLLPAHGSPTNRPAKALEDTLAHRRKREEQLVAALAGGARRIAELAPELYKGLPAELMRFAELQILAGLLKLQGEGRVEGEGEEWRLR